MGEGGGSVGPPSYSLAPLELFSWRRRCSNVLHHASYLPTHHMRDNYNSPMWPNDF